MPNERGGTDIDLDEAGSTVTIYDSRPSLAVQAASVVFGAKAAAAVLGGLWWGAKTAAAAYETTLGAAESGLSIVSAATELTGGTANAWAPPALVVVGAATWAFTRRSVRRVVLRIDRVVGQDAEDERIRITHMPSLPWLRAPVLEVPRADCEAAEGNSLTPNFYSEPGGRWYLLPMPGWRSEDKEYLKVFLFWRFFRDEPEPPADEALIQIEGFGPYRPMQFADPSHPVARRIGWPAREETLESTPFRSIEGDVYADFRLGRKLSIDEQRSYAAKARLHGRDAADRYLAELEASRDDEDSADAEAREPARRGLEVLAEGGGSGAAAGSARQ